MVSSFLCLSKRSIYAVLLGFLVLSSVAQAVAPAAPTAATATYSTYNYTGFGPEYPHVWRISWQDNSTDEDGFALYVRINGGGGYGEEIWWSNIASGGVKTTTGRVTRPLFLTGAKQFWYFLNNNYFPYPGVQWIVKSIKGNVPANAAPAAADVSAPAYTTAFEPVPGPQTPTLLTPTGLSVTSPSDGAFQITFTDTSNCEAEFELQYKKSTDTEWVSTQAFYGEYNSSGFVANDYDVQSVANGTDNTPNTNDDTYNFISYLQPGTTYNFRIRAVDWNQAPSAWSATVTNTTQAPLKAPTGLTATRVGENRFDLAFVNNSTAESGYQFQYRAVGASTWQELGTINDPFFNIINTGNLPPNTNYEFQVRAFIRPTHNLNATLVYSDFSNIATGSAIFTAPTNLTATSPSEGKVNLAWTDNSSAEGNYEIQVRVKGTTTWTVWDYVNANVTSLNDQIVAPGEILEFQVRATYGPQAEVVSAFTNIAEVTTTFNAPTGFTVTASPTDPYRISFAWTDNSAVETHHELQYRKVGDANYATRKLAPNNGGAAPNNMSFANLPEFDPGSVYDFRIRAVVMGSNGSVISGTPFITAMATTLNGFSSKPYAPITMGTPFNYQMTTLSQQARTDWSVGTLPAGLTFDSTTGVISGTPTVAGLFQVPMTANFTGGTSHVLNLALRILRPTGAPQIAEAIGQQTLAPGGSTTVPLSGKFSDLDTEAAVRLTTSKGNLDVVLYNTQTPTTVANFRAYNYADTIFHRAPTGFVVQGGGYRIGPSPDVFDSVTRQAAIANEPGISNLYGTVAMAKVGDDPNSATSEFFFSLGNNSLNLDNQNGGFTVFGRLSTPTLNVLSALAAVPTSSYGVKLREDGVTTPSSANFVFSDIPIDQSPVPTTIDQTKLMKITAVAELPIMTYTVDVADANVATATLSGSDLHISAVGPGTTTMIITAMDVDANIAQQTVTVNVSQVPGTVIIDSATLAQTYDGTARVVTATTTPAGLNVVVTYDGSSTPPTNAGSYAVVAAIVDSHYGGTANGTLVVAKAAATLTLNGLDQGYDGTPKSVTATTSPASLGVTYTYDGSATPPTNHGSYAVVGTISDTNYEGTKSGTLVIRGQTAAEWRMQKFTQQQITAGVAGDDGDPDGDGLKNLAEYALGSDPNSSTSPLPPPVRDANGFTLTFTRPKGLPGVIYGAESSDSLTAGSWTPLTVELVTDGPVQTVRVRDPLSSGNLTRRFIRLLFQLPPP